MIFEVWIERSHAYSALQLVIASEEIELITEYTCDARTWTIVLVLVIWLLHHVLLLHAKRSSDLTEIAFVI